MTELLLWAGLAFVLFAGGRPGAPGATGEGPQVVVGYRNGVAFELPVVDVGGGFLLRADAAAWWRAMAAAAQNAGVTLQLNSAFRTWAQQAALYAKYLAGAGNRAAPPGDSNHQQGTTVDVETAGGTNAAFFWLSNNASQFGFYRTVADEPWHWEFV